VLSIGALNLEIFNSDAPTGVRPVNFVKGAGHLVSSN